jgi:hypothetical protein
MEVSGQLHDPAALPQEKQPLVPTRQEAGWAPQPVWTKNQDKIFPTNLSVKSFISFGNDKTYRQTKTRPSLYAISSQPLTKERIINTTYFLLTVN